MVRKIIYAVVALAVLLAVPMSASAATIYDGNISSTYTSIFKDIVQKEMRFNESYVYFRSDQYEYSLVVGNLTYEDNKFSSDGEVRVYKIDTQSSSYNSAYEYTVSTEPAFSLTVDKQLIYSNLGDFPDLIERTNYYEMATLILLIVCILLYLLRSLFSFNLRLQR